MKDSKEKMTVQVLPNIFRKYDGKLDKEGIELFSGHCAGVCYSPDGYNSIIKEDKSKTFNRADGTLDRYHFSVYGHVYISLYIENIPKILAMVLNNEKEYNTSEKSARYTKIIKDEDLEEEVDVKDSTFTQKEKELYLKWFEILEKEITKEYGNTLESSKIKKLAQENARYMVTVFMPTKMVYTTSFAQYNQIVGMMRKYIFDATNTLNPDPFKLKLANSMEEFISCLDCINMIEERLCVNPKNRSISLFNDDVDKKVEYFGDVYSTTYSGSFAQIAQGQRHRTLDYEIKRKDDKEFYIPEIIKGNSLLQKKWKTDIQSVTDVVPQGEMVDIWEGGPYEKFIWKLTERLCSNAQLEINNQSRDTLQKYHDALVASNHYLKDDIEKYMHGARCTFPNFNCPEDCNFKEGKILRRKI